MHNEKTEFLKFRIIVEIARKSAYFHLNQSFGHLWPENSSNELNSPKNALPKYFWNVLKNCSNEIRIRQGPMYSIFKLRHDQIG